MACDLIMAFGAYTPVRCGQKTKIRRILVISVLLTIYISIWMCQFLLRECFLCHQIAYFYNYSCIFCHYTREYGQNNNALQYGVGFSGIFQQFFISIFSLSLPLGVQTRVLQHEYAFYSLMNRICANELQFITKMIRISFIPLIISVISRM